MFDRIDGDLFTWHLIKGFKKTSISPFRAIIKMKQMIRKKKTNPFFTISALHTNLLLPLVTSCLPAFFLVSVCCNNKMFSEHSGAFVRIHLTVTTVLGGGYNYSFHDTDELTKTGKGTCPTLFSWQLTGRAGV